MDDEGEQPPQQPPVLVCTAESVKLLVTLLGCLSASDKKDQRVRCDVDRHGLLFTAHSKGKSLQIKTSVGAELFETYEFHAPAPTQRRHPYDSDSDHEHGAADDDEDDGVSFALNMTTLVECLSMFGSLATTSLRMSYLAQSATLMLVVEDNGVLCECSMQVLEHEGNDMGHLEFESAFENSAVIGRCIIQSEPLHDAFSELYALPSAACVKIAMFSDASRAPKCLSLSATSETGSCEIEFARSSSAFIEFFCAPLQERDAGCAASFHVAVLQQAFKALGNSNETFLRMNGDGFLSVQHMIETGTGDKAFVDALISPEDTSIP